MVYMCIYTSQNFGVFNIGWKIYSFINTNTLKKIINFFQGKLKDEEQVLEWLINPDTMAVSDIIEKVNEKMFARVLERFEYVASFFCKYIKFS